MRKSLFAMILITVILTLSSCLAITPAPTKSESDTQEKLIANLSSKISKLEEQVEILKKQTVESEINSYILNLFTNDTNTLNQSFFLDKKVEGNELRSLLLKVPKKDHFITSLVVITGKMSESGFKSIDKFTIPVIVENKEENLYSKYNIDSLKYDILTYSFEKIAFDDDTFLIMILTDNAGNVYHEFRNSDSFFKDV